VGWRRTRRAGRGAGVCRLGVGAVVACGLCCALPVIGVRTGIGALSTIAAVVEPISLVLAVVALGGAVLLERRRRRRKACRVTDLGMPGSLLDGTADGAQVGAEGQGRIGAAGGEVGVEADLGA
jgi:hypothetical protein